MTWGVLRFGVPDASERHADHLVVLAVTAADQSGREQIAQLNEQIL